MNLRNCNRNERGVSEVIGFLFIVIIVVMMSISYQASFVPQLNEEADWQANNELESQSLEVNSIISTVVADGSPRTQAIGVDIDYPTQVGTPLTSWEADSSSGDIQVSGTVGSDAVYGTNLVKMRGLYLSDDYGAFWYENGLTVYESPEGVNVVKNSQSVIRDDRIVLTRVESAPVSESSSSPLMFSVTASETTSSTTVSPDGDTMSVTVPTRLSKETWLGLVDDELAGNGGNIESVNYTSNSGSPNEVEFVLDGSIDYTLVTGGVEIRAN